MTPSSRKYRLQPRLSDDILLLGIISDEKDYRLTWLLNRHFGWQLKHSGQWSWHERKLPVKQLFPYYQNQETPGADILLIVNRSSGGYRLPAYQRFDYLLIVMGASHPDQSDQLVREIRSVETVRGVYPADPEDISLLIQK